MVVTPLTLPSGRLKLPPTCKTTGADLGILVGGGLTLFAIPIIYLQHLFSNFHYQLGSPGGGINPPWIRLWTIPLPVLTVC